MTKTLGRIDPKTPLYEFGAQMIETDALSPTWGFDTPIFQGKLVTHIWTSNTTGGLISYYGVDLKPHVLYLARDIGVIQVALTQILSVGTTLLATEIWIGRTANYMYDEQV